MPTFEHRWRDYTDEELLTWVRLYLKRATHRSNPVKIQQDIKNAADYMLSFQMKKAYETGVDFEDAF